MEDRQLPIVLGQGAGARTVTLDLPAFTLVGATTRAGLLTTPLRDRFGVSQRLEHYEPDHLAEIVRRSAGILEVEIEPEGERVIAERSRGTPRVANRLLKRVRDFAQVRGEGVITAAVAGRGARPARGRRRRPRPPRPHDPGDDRGQVLRRAGRALDPGRRRRRGAGDDRGRLRALPAPAGPDQAHPARPGGRPSARFEHLGLRGARAARASACSERRVAAGQASRSASIRCQAEPSLGFTPCPSSSARTAGTASSPASGPGSARARRRARSAARRSCSSCSTTTTRRPTPPSSSATRRRGCSTSAATASSSPGSRTSR